ncbi:MAG: signal peptidase I [Proteobacteria bacterium]|nr:signal peptidase I [Pseudomonadota bacterium]
MTDEQLTTSNQDSSPKKELFRVEDFRILFFLVFLALCIRSSIVAPYEVPTASMEPTIKVGDRIVANKLAYGFRVPFINYEVIRWGQVKRGEIIVFRFPMDPNLDFVKRVVAIAGDKVQIFNDRLYINGQPIERIDQEDRSILDDVGDRADIKDLYVEQIDKHAFFVTQDTRNILTVRNRNWPHSGEPYLVPKEAVFVMGDNRDNSLDSRKWQHVPLVNVKGRAEFVIWSSKSSGGVLPDMRWSRVFKSLYGQTE